MNLSRLLSITVLLSAFAVFTASPTQAQISFGNVGVSVGGNLETINDLSSGDTEASFGSSVGFNAGVSYDQPLDMAVEGLSVRPAFVARRLGTYSFSSELSGQGAALLQGEEFNVWMFEFPLDIRYQFPVDLGPASLYGLLGPQVSVPRAANDFDATMNDVSYSLNVGAGVELDLPAGLTLLPEIRYEYGLSNTFKEEFTYRFREFEVGNPPSVGAVSLRIHLYFL